MKRQILIFVLCVALLSGSMFLTPIGASELDEELLAISKKSGIPVSELLEMKEWYGEQFYQVVDEYIGILDQYHTSNDYERWIGLQSMSEEQWHLVKFNAFKGDILMSKDQHRWIVNHGHAAIVWEHSERTVEALGKTSGPSNDYSIDWWKELNTVRIYYPEHVSYFVRRDAADYAYNNLRGKEYKILPLKDDPDYLNCASLVWQAYKSQGVTLNAGLYSIPSTLILDPNLYMKVSVNWSGNQYTW